MEGEGEKVVKERGHGLEVGRWGKKERIRKKEGHGNRKGGGGREDKGERVILPSAAGTGTRWRSWRR